MRCCENEIPRPGRYEKGGKTCFWLHNGKGCELSLWRRNSFLNGPARSFRLWNASGPFHIAPLVSCSLSSWERIRDLWSVYAQGGSVPRLDNEEPKKNKHFWCCRLQLNVSLLHDLQIQIAADRLEKKKKNILRKKSSITKWECCPLDC